MFDRSLIQGWVNCKGKLKPFWLTTEVIKVSQDEYTVDAIKAMMNFYYAGHCVVEELRKIEIKLQQDKLTDDRKNALALNKQQLDDSCTHETKTVYMEREVI